MSRRDPHSAPTTNRLADGSAWLYGYDDMGQLTSARKRFSDGIPVGGAQFQYSYDTIGNRVSALNFAGQRTQVEAYESNGLNQYLSRTVPGQVWVSGSASPSAAVSVRIGTNSPAL
ncbi:MAG: hypothetical protein FJ224_13165, partial [Lentisphaerae bacterium]|nr:hypothetical protein [Lentisphaerota bacterium]